MPKHRPKPKPRLRPKPKPKLRPMLKNYWTKVDWTVKNRLDGQSVIEPANSCNKKRDF
jgi:hypothetical protein